MRTSRLTCLAIGRTQLLILGWYTWISRQPFSASAQFIKSTRDCAYQLSVLSGMRTLFQAIFNRTFRRGPFVFSFTDLHQSNIFVDAEWHITCLVDLEWTCTRPIEMFQPPHWFTDKSVDQMDSTEYEEIRQEFMGSLRKEEEGILSATPTATVAGSQLSLSEIMEQSWETGAFWYPLALSSPSGIFWVFTKHIQSRFFEDLERDVREEYELVMPFLFDQKATRIAARKLDDKKEYDKKLRRAFGDNSDRDLQVLFVARDLSLPISLATRLSGRAKIFGFVSLLVLISHDSRLISRWASLLKALDGCFDSKNCLLLLRHPWMETNFLAANVYQHVSQIETIQTQLVGLIFSNLDGSEAEASRVLKSSGIIRFFHCSLVRWRSFIHVE